MNRRASLDSSELHEIQLFVVYRRHAIRVAVSPFRVVEHLDVIEHVATGFFPACIDFALDPLTLE